DQIRGGHRLADTVPPAAALDQVVEQQSEDVVRLKEGAVFVHDAEAVGIAVGGNADVGLHFAHFDAHGLEQVVVRLGRVTAEQHIAIIVHGGNLNPGVAQQR